MKKGKVGIGISGPIQSPLHISGGSVSLGTINPTAKLKIKKRYWIVEIDGTEREVSAIEYYFEKSIMLVLMISVIGVAISAIGVLIDIIRFN